MSYEPHPGTVPYRVIEFLRGNPGQHETGAICKALDLVPASFTTLLSVAKQRGVVSAQRSGKTTLWSLPSGQRGAVDQDDLRIPKFVPSWTPPKMVAPRPGSDRQLASSPRPPMPEAPPPAPCPPAACEQPEAAPVVVAAPEQVEQPEIIHEPEPPDIDPLAEPEEPAEPVEFDAWLSLKTGQLQIIGADIDDEGRVTMTPEQVRMLRGAIAWMPA